jgi:hypothetical protein
MFSSVLDSRTNVNAFCTTIFALFSYTCKRTAVFGGTDSSNYLYDSDMADTKPKRAGDLQTAQIYVETSADLAELQSIRRRQILAGGAGPLPSYPDLIAECVSERLERLAQEAAR